MLPMILNTRDEHFDGSSFVDKLPMSEWEKKVAAS